MRSIVANVARAERVPPMPVVMKAVCLERHVFCRSTPQVVVQATWRLGGLGMADTRTKLHVPCFRDEHIADDTLTQLIHGIHHQRRTALLRAVLHHSTAADGCFEKQLAFTKVMAARLFDIHMLAGF